MFSRKANRRRVDRPLARVRLPALGTRWRSVLRMTMALAVTSGSLIVAFRVGALVLDRPVRKLVVEGAFQRVTPLQVEAAIRDGLEDGFWTVDLAAARARVQALDWVDQVDLRRSWPDTMIVRIVEHQAAARWGERGLLNVRGELFTEQSQYAFPELPSLAGPDGSEREVARRYLAVRGQLAEADLALKTLRMDDRGSWRLVLAGGQEIRLGRRDVDERFYRFFAVVAPALVGELKRVAYVDLRYTNGFAVGWREESRTDQALVASATDRD